MEWRLITMANHTWSKSSSHVMGEAPILHGTRSSTWWNAESNPRKLNAHGLRPRLLRMTGALDG